jgi:hypothetical protein
MSQGQSKFGFYCFPKGQMGWRYVVVPPPHGSEQKTQCEASDCLETLIKDNSVKYMRYDKETKMCMGSICEGNCGGVIKPQSTGASKVYRDVREEGNNAHECGDLDEEVKACNTVLGGSGGLCWKFGPQDSALEAVQFLPQGANDIKFSVKNCDLDGVSHTVWVDPGTRNRRVVPTGALDNPIIVANDGSAFDAWQTPHNFDFRSETFPAFGISVDTSVLGFQIDDVPGAKCASLSDTSEACTTTASLIIDSCNPTRCWGRRNATTC